MKCGKAPGPDEVNLEMILALGDEGVLWVHSNASNLEGKASTQ